MFLKLLSSDSALPTTTNVQKSLLGGSDTSNLSLSSIEVAPSKPMEGHKHIANLLVEKGAEVNKLFGELGTALVGAVLADKDEMVRFLLEKGLTII